MIKWTHLKRNKTGRKKESWKPNEDMAHLKRDIMDALTRSDEKWIATQKDRRKMECYSRKTDER